MAAAAGERRRSGAVQISVSQARRLGLVRSTTRLTSTTTVTAVFSGSTFGAKSVSSLPLKQFHDSKRQNTHG